MMTLAIVLAMQLQVSEPGCAVTDAGADESSNSAVASASGREAMESADQLTAASDEVALRRCPIWLRDLRPDATLVDVRPASRHESAWVPGSAHVPIVESGRIAAINADEVVIFGDGTDDIALIQLCASLHTASNTNVRVLVGGIRALARGGVRVEGRGAGGNTESLDDIEFARLLRQRDVDVIDLAEHKPEQLAQLRARLNGARARSQPSSARKAVLPVVYLLPEGQSPSTWRSRLGLRANDNALFYTSGLDRFERFVRRREAVMTNAGRALPTSCEWNS